MAKKTSSKSRKKNSRTKGRPSLIAQVVFLAVLVLVAAFVILQTLKKPIEPEVIADRPDKPGPSTETPLEDGVEIAVNLWFGDEGGEYFIPVTRLARAPEGSDPHAVAVKELLKGPRADSMFSPFPEGTELNEIRLKDGIATVDFTSELASYGGGTAGEAALIRCLVLTLTEFEDVKRIQILIDGKLEEYLPEGMTIDVPLGRDDLSSDLGFPESDDYSLYTIFKNDRGYLFPDFQIAHKRKNLPYTAFRQQLGSKVQRGGISPVIPPSFALKNAEIKGEIVRVELEHKAPDLELAEVEPAEFMKACALVACQFDTSLSLELLINGRPIHTFAGFDSYLEPVKRPVVINPEVR